MITLGASVRDRDVLRALDRAIRRGRDMRPAFEVAGEIVRTSVVMNYAEGGRPEQWPESMRAKEKGGKTLVKTSRLLGSINARAYLDRVEIGTNVPYAALHHFGFDGEVSVGRHIRKVKSRDVKEGRKTVAKGIATVRPHRRRMRVPARPFMLVQEEDWPRIDSAVMDYITEGEK